MPEASVVDVTPSSPSFVPGSRADKARQHEAKKAEAKQAAAVALAERKANQLAQVRAGLDGELPELFLAWLEQVAGTTTVELLYAKLYERLRKSLHPSAAWRWQGHDGNKAVMALSQQERQYSGLPKQLTLPIEEGCKLILQDEEHLAPIIAARAEAYRETVQKRADEQEADRPAWFSGDLMLAWSKRQRKAMKKGVKTHPAEDHFNQMSKDEVRALGLARAGGTRYEADVAGQINVGDATQTVKRRVTISGMPKRVWEHKKAKDLQEAVAAVLHEEGQKWGVEAQEVVDHPDSGARWTFGTGAKLQLSAKQWGEMVAKVFGKVANGRLEAFPAAMEEALEARVHELQILSCAKALPEHLGDLYPLARKMRRKLTLVCGPTNSGKTHQGIERLKAAGSGLYLGPLRLLALEIRDRLEAEGHPTSLITGELIEEKDGARLSACTVEMLDFERPVECILIDEVQMLSDPQRGAAWVQAILGAPAQEVWMLGAPEAEEAVRALAAYLDEPIEIIRTERLTPMVIETKHTHLSKIPNQSAVVAFSRREVLNIAAELQGRYGRSCAIVYGALSPEVRSIQAERFRSGEAEIVVATDAISMGLNLSCKSVYFSAHEKWNGTVEEPISQDLAWQIAGRAGRFGFHDDGRVGALYGETLHAIKDMLATRPDAVAERFCHGPTWPLVQLVGRHLQTDNLQKILSVFEKDLRLSADKRFAPVLMENQMIVAKLVDRFPLRLRDKLTLSAAPIPFNKEEMPEEYEEFVAAVAAGDVVNFARLGPHRAAEASHNQERAENAVKMLTLYCWLHYRFEDVFPDFEEAQANISALNDAIAKHLRRQKPRSCKKCGKQLSWAHSFRSCDDCHATAKSRRPANL